MALSRLVEDVPWVLGNPWHWQRAIEIQTMFETTGERYLATLLAVGMFAVTVAVVYGIRRALKTHVSSDTIQFTQGFVITLVSILLTGFLVAVWRLTAEVESALAFLIIQPEVYIRLLVTFIVVGLGVTTTRLTKRSIKYGAARDSISAHQREVAHHLVQILVFIPVVAFVVVLWELPVGSVFLGAGALGIVVGFAARQTLSGALSGFVILFARPFEVGDWIRVNEREGIVTDVTLYNTQIRTFNEEHVLVPNDQVTGNEVLNYSKTERLRLTADVGVDYDCDIATAAAVATEALESCENVAASPKPDVIRHSFGDSAVVLRLRYWIDRPTVQRKWSAQNEAIEAVKAAFEREAIKIPYPQRELQGRKESGGLQVATEARGTLETDDRTIVGTVDGNHRQSPHRTQGSTDVEEPVEGRFGDEGGQRDGDEDEDEDKEMDGGERPTDGSQRRNGERGGAGDENRDGEGKQ